MRHFQHQAPSTIFRHCNFNISVNFKSNRFYDFIVEKYADRSGFPRHQQDFIIPVFVNEPENNFLTNRIVQQAVHYPIYPIYCIITGPEYCYSGCKPDVEIFFCIIITSAPVAALPAKRKIERSQISDGSFMNHFTYCDTVQ